MDKYKSVKVWTVYTGSIVASNYCSGGILTYNYGCVVYTMKRRRCIKTLYTQKSSNIVLCATSINNTLTQLASLKVITLLSGVLKYYDIVKAIKTEQ